VVSSQRRNRHFFVPRCKSGRDLVDKKWFPANLLSLFVKSGAMSRFLLVFLLLN
jgi:hypothetical protein